MLNKIEVPHLLICDVSPYLSSFGKVSVILYTAVAIFRDFCHPIDFSSISILMMLGYHMSLNKILKNDVF